MGVSATYTSILNHPRHSSSTYSANLDTFAITILQSNFLNTGIKSINSTFLWFFWSRWVQSYAMMFISTILVEKQHFKHFSSTNLVKSSLNLDYSIERQAQTKLDFWYLEWFVHDEQTDLSKLRLTSWHLQPSKLPKDLRDFKKLCVNESQLGAIIQKLVNLLL